MNRYSARSGPATVQLPLRMGFFLAEMGVNCARGPEIPYRGINRLASLKDFEGEFQQHQSGASEVWSLWASYWEAESTGTISVDRSTALDFQERFRALGMNIETIFCELVQYPSIRGHDELSAHQQQRLHDAFTKYEHVQRQLPNRPAGLEFLGYDLSYPLPTFHSIIRQPAIMNSNVVIPTMLNNSGLIADLDIAAELLPRANRDQKSGPICVLGIWSVESLNGDAA